MKSIVEQYQSRAEWLAARGGSRIGASEVAAALGVSPWQSPWDLWERKVAGRQAAATEEQARGHLWEPIVLRLYEHEMDTTVAVLEPGEYELHRHPDHDWAVQTPDALVWLPGGGAGQVEAKTSTDIAAWGEGCTITPGWDEAWPLPVTYALQAYWQIEVADVEWVDLAVLLPCFELRTYRILPDPERQQLILAQVAAWRERHLIEGEPPEVDESDACGRYVRSLRSGERAATAQEEALAFELAQARARRKLEDRAVRRLSNELGMSAAGATLRLRSGRRIAPRRMEPEPEHRDPWAGVADDDFAALHVGPGSK